MGPAPALDAPPYQSHPPDTVLTVTLRGDGVMKRRAFVAGVGALLVTSPVEGQQPARVYKIGYLHPGTAPQRFTPPVQNALDQTFSEFGLAEGKNLVWERRGAQGRPERLPELAAELVRLNVDVIIAIGALAAHAARHATRTIPIVIAYVADPEDEGLVASLARPGGNVTGVASFGVEFGAKQLQLIKELLPRASRILIVAQRGHASSLRAATKLQETATPLGLSVLIAEVDNSEDLEKSFDSIKARRPDAIWFWSTAIGVADYSRTIELAARHRLPDIYGVRRPVELGALMSYGESNPSRFRRIARYVGKILRGAKPADLPIEQPSEFELVLNRKTAVALGLTIPSAILLRADEVIQ